MWLWAIIAALGASLWAIHTLRSRGTPASSASVAGSTPRARDQDDRPLFATYAGSESCRSCHEEEYQEWRSSHHGLAERDLSPAQDQAAFEPGRTISHGTQHSHLAWTNDHAMAVVPGLSGHQETFFPPRVIGQDPLRQFLVPAPGGRWQALEIAFDPGARDWFDVYGQEDRKPGEWGHWTGRGMNWNNMCAGCHNTRLRENYDAGTDSYRTSMAEMSVGCEACHGPLKSHNQWQNEHHNSGVADPTLSRTPPSQALDTCGFCHARRSSLTGDFKPGDTFGDHCHLAIPDGSDLFYADGQVREEDYEYAAFLGSKMHLRGVLCLDCHLPHSAKTRLPGNWLCLRCHDGSRSNAPAINPSLHSHHQVFGFDSSGQLTNSDLMTYQPNTIKQTGGECVNCHMPQTAYMQRHWRHDHGFTIPDPLLTRQFAIPNACNRCHKDKDTEWANHWVEEWYGPKMERPSRQRTKWIARARDGDPAAQAGLVSLLAGEDNPYWRAVEVGLLGAWADDALVVQVLLRGLNDTNSLVRASTLHALEPALEGAGLAAEAIRQRLNDPLRAVRLAAAWALRTTIDEKSAIGQELLRSLAVNASQPSGQMMLGQYSFSRNDLQQALVHFQTAVQWDSNSPPFRQGLAVVLSALGKPQQALEQLRDASRLAPRDADIHYQLALAWNETGDLQQTAAELESATRLNPRHARAWYNLGLAQNGLGSPDKAIESLLRAETLSPRDPRIPYARATILATQGRKREARVAASRALDLNPAFSEAKQLVESLDR